MRNSTSKIIFYVPLAQLFLNVLIGEIICIFIVLRLEPILISSSLLSYWFHILVKRAVLCIGETAASSYLHEPEKLPARRNSAKLSRVEDFINGNTAWFCALGRNQKSCPCGKCLNTINDTTVLHPKSIIKPPAFNTRSSHAFVQKNIIF